MEERIRRIAEMEACLNRLLAWLEHPAGEIREEVRRLDGYYSGPLWLEDYEADEAGELPADLARGVLSEDAVYNALADYDALAEAWKREQRWGEASAGTHEQ